MYEMRDFAATTSGYQKRVDMLNPGSTGFVATFSADGNRVAKGMANNSTLVLDLQRGADWDPFRSSKKLSENGRVHSIVFSPDGALVATGGDKDVSIWNTATGKQTQILKGRLPGIPVDSLSFSPDGKLLAAGGRELRVWDLASENVEPPSFVLDASALFVRCVAFSPAGTLISSSAENLYHWDIKSKRLLGVLRGHQGAIDVIAFSPDGTRIVSGSTDNTVRLWDVNTRESVTDISPDALPYSMVRFDADGKHIVCASDEILRKFAASTGELVQEWRLRGKPLATSQDGDSIAVWGQNDALEIWSSGSGKITQTFQGYSGGPHFGRVVFVGNGRQLLRLSNDRRDAILWNVLDGQVSLELPARVEAVSRPRKTWAGEIRSNEGNVITTLAASADGKYVACAYSAERAIVLWDVEKRKRLRTIPGPEDRYGVNKMMFAPDNTHLAIAGLGVVEIHPIVASEPVQVFDTEGEFVQAMTYSPDGRRLATCSHGRNAKPSVRIWDTSSGQQVFAIRDIGLATCVAFSPDRKRLVIGGDQLQILETEVSTANVMWRYRKSEIGETTPVGPRSAESVPKSLNANLNLDADIDLRNETVAAIRSAQGGVSASGAFCNFDVTREVRGGVIRVGRIWASINAPLFSW